MGLKDLLKAKPDPTLRRIENKVEQLAEALHNLCRDLDRHHNVTVTAVERNGSTLMATLQNLGELISQARGDAQAEAQEVKGRLDEMNALIEELRNNSNDPAEVERLAGELTSLRTDIQSVFTNVQPVPSPQPEPGPAPEGRRR